MSLRWKRIVFPVGVLLAGFLIAYALISSRGSVRRRPGRVPPPLVRTVTVHSQDYQFHVTTQGTVMPRTEATLVPEVGGRVTWVSPSLAAGGFFAAGDVLFRIDARDYELAVTRAGAEVARAEVRLSMEKAESQTARAEWSSLGDGEGSPLVLREPQLREAQANLDAARATLAQAELNLDRARVRAPFDGRVRTESVDIGQYVARGAPVGSIYAVDYVEIRLPLPDRELAYLEAPLTESGDVSGDSLPTVILSGDFAGERHEWHGNVVRTEGELDPVSRMVHVVARVKDPYGRHDADDQTGTPLPVGLFVDAEIAGRAVSDVVVLPREAIRADGRVYVVDDQDRLQFRDVRVLRTSHGTAIVGDGLRDGERVCLSSLDAAINGMTVRTMQDTDDQVTADRPATLLEGQP